MNISRRKRTLMICAYLGPVVCGLVGFAAPAGAQSALTPTASLSASDADAVDTANEKLRKRVADALHVDPYFYDKHVTVSVDEGSVVLRGFVMSSWDLQEALRIARKAAGDRPVVDNLSIKLGGGR